MKGRAASLPAPMIVVVLAAALSACGAAEDAAAPPVGEERALEQAEAMLQERVPETAEDTASPAP